MLAAGFDVGGVDVSGDILADADTVVRIPMFGDSESLNVGVAAGVALYEALRQRTGDKGHQSGDVGI